MRKILCIGKDKPAGGTAENMGTVPRRVQKQAILLTAGRTVWTQ